eukprot:CAMPEP_0175266254 /NCGR_PEP_ID=MMETSP0093-20121207/43236_1 /TAXON_ID=311494 /ORGANISM="Alexandrium monilatum, Strain CCMP3105" /LENGTH=84 /DNA_ID=CAMNT_0016560849 /DNA_START=41 /DNA_END=291 /DNA_ORIENTATION=-
MRQRREGNLRQQHFETIMRPRQALGDTAATAWRKLKERTELWQRIKQGARQTHGNAATLLLLTWPPHTRARARRRTRGLGAETG